jgi:hypothetical protein
MNIFVKPKREWRRRCTAAAHFCGLKPARRGPSWSAKDKWWRNSCYKPQNHLGAYPGLQ